MAAAAAGPSAEPEKKAAPAGDDEDALKKLPTAVGKYFSDMVFNNLLEAAKQSAHLVLLLLSSILSLSLSLPASPSTSFSAV